MLCFAGNDFAVKASKQLVDECHGDLECASSETAIVFMRWQVLRCTRCDKSRRHLQLGQILKCLKFGLHSLKLVSLTHGPDVPNSAEIARCAPAAPLSHVRSLNEI